MAPGRSVFGIPLAALAWLGRQGTRAIAALAFIGIAVPPLGHVLKPFVTEAIFVLLTIAFLRLDWRALRGYIGRPGLILAATVWTMVGVPALFAGAALAVGLDRTAPDLLLALMLQAVASPMMAAPAFAALMGLDATLVLVALIAGSALTPVTAPLFAHLAVGPALALSPTALGLKLFAILAGSAAAATVLRRVVGPAVLQRHRQSIDGLNILVVFVFVAAVMENVAARLFAQPLATLGLAVLAFGTSFGVLGLTAVVFARAGRGRALALAMMASQRNMGLMLAAAGGALPELVWLYFALCQFPIYVAPQIFYPVARRWAATRPTG